ncbi:MAG: hypothetical protein DDT38_01451 [Firmicutes bacterium]|nr:hypothetical protein [candidate division NPL-UPA2 bacterium]
MRTHAYLGVVAQRVVLEGVGYTVVANSLQAVVVIRVGVNDAILGSCLKASHGIVGVAGSDALSISKGFQQALELGAPIVGHSLTTGVGNGLGVVTARGVGSVCLDLQNSAAHIRLFNITVFPFEVVDYVFGAGGLGNVTAAVLVLKLASLGVNGFGKVVVSIELEGLILLGQILYRL